MTIIEALERLEGAARGNARLEVLKTVDSLELREILVMALSPQITFGVKKLPKYEDKQNGFGDDSFRRGLLRLLKRLQVRELTGGAAQEGIADFLSLCNPTEAKWAERVIKQDLRLDLGAKDVNNALGEGTIFQFAVPLAVKTQEKDGSWSVTEKDLKGKWCVEPKLDGARCVAYLPANKGRVTLLSRTGKEWLNFESIREKLQEINNLRNPTQGVVLDGEVVSLVDDKINFQALQATLFRKDGKETGKLRYMIFDGAIQSEWENPTSPYVQRWNFAKAFVQDSLRDVPGALARVGFVEMFQTENPTIERMVKYNLDFAEKGFEGAMLRKADMAVQMKRHKSLLKVKTFIDEEAEVIGAVSGQGKRENILGALTCKREDGTVFELGSGYTDDDLKRIWEMHQKGSLPKWATYKYQPPLTDDGKPRFPIFKGFRHGDDFVQ